MYGGGGWGSTGLGNIPKKYHFFSASLMQLWQLTMPGVADEEGREDMSGKGREQLQSKSFPDTSNKRFGKEKERTP